MKNSKRKFTAEFKVQVLREHLEKQMQLAKFTNSIIFNQIYFISKQPDFPHKHWRVDIKYLNFNETFLFLMKDKVNFFFCF